MKYISGEFLEKLQRNLIGNLKLVAVTDEQIVSKFKNGYISKKSNSYCVSGLEYEYDIQVFDTIKNQKYQVNEILLIRIIKTKEKDCDYNFIELECPELLVDNFYELRADNRSDYMMLGRLQTDCDNFLGYGCRNIKKLWAGDIKIQIAEMRKLWDGFLDDEKPTWLTLEQINKYEKEMLDI